MLEMEHQKITFFFSRFSSCTKSCPSSCFLFDDHTPNRALVRAFLSFSSCTKSCFFLVFFVHQVVLFSGFLRAPNRAFFVLSSCTKPCFFLLFFVHQIVLFSGFLRAPNRAFLRFSSCTKWCPTSCHCYRGWARHNR